MDEYTEQADLTGLDEDWNDDSDLLSDEGAETATEKPQNVDQQTADSQETKEPTGDSDKAKADALKDQFTLKYMDEERTVGRDEIIQLAQKGMDYDRIRTKYDESKDKMKTLDEYSAFLGELAKAQNVDIPTLIDATRARVKAQREGITEASALERIQLDKRASELDRRAAELDAKQTERTAEEERTAKRDKDISEFLGEYGKDFDIKRIPQEVWLSVSKGNSLLGAYQAYENKQLKARIADMEQSAKNKERSTGSKTTSLGTETKDKWFEGWDDE